MKGKIFVIISAAVLLAAWLIPVAIRTHREPRMYFAYGDGTYNSATAPLPYNNR